MSRQPDAELVAVVQRFRHRRRWRHLLAIGLGSVALIVGPALVAARLAPAAPRPASNPSFAVGVALYGAGALAAGWGAAGGFTRRLGRWVLGSLLFGALAMLVLLIMAVLSQNGDSVFSNGRADPSAGRSPRPTRAGPATSPPAGAGLVLAAELLDTADLERLLGPGVPARQTPGSVVARATSMAIWRADGRGRPSERPSVSLTVRYSARRARRTRAGHRPAGAQHAAGLDGGFVQHVSGGRVTRVRAARGDWVVTLQLRGPADRGDAGPLLTALTGHVLGLLAAAEDAAQSQRAAA
jgi:hypothetical protein